MRVRVGAGRLYFDVEGAQLVPDGPEMREKPTLLVLHGGPGFDHSTMKPWFSAMQDAVQVVYLDHRGNGRSDGWDADDLDLERWGDDVRDFCEALEIRQPIVLGVSFGGFVAQSYATRHPEHPRALVLCNTTARFRADRVLDAFERLGGAEARGVAKAYLGDPDPGAMAEFARVCLPLYNRRPQDPHFLPRAMALANFPLAMSYFRDGLRRFDFLSTLASVRCPTLVVVSDDDPITPPADGEDIAAALPPDLVRLERFAGCGHPAYQDDPDRFFGVLRQFVASV